MEGGLPTLYTLERTTYASIHAADPESRFVLKFQCSIVQYNTMQYSGVECTAAQHTA